MDDTLLNAAANGSLTALFLVAAYGLWKLCHRVGQSDCLMSAETDEAVTLACMQAVTTVRNDVYLRHYILPKRLSK